MKLKFLLVSLAIVGLIVGSYADCNKDEVFKLLDKGYSKSEIDALCEKSEKKKSKLIEPSYGCDGISGFATYDGCRAYSWLSAKRVCSASGGKLPTRNDFKKLVVECGGSFTIYGNKDWNSLTDKNLANKSYQACCKKKGFNSLYGHWTREEKDSSNAWNFNFRTGSIGWFNKSNNRGYILCVR